MAGPARGREVKVALLALSLVSTVVVHLPWLPIEVQAGGQQFLYLTGHEHTWSLFAANPRNVSLALWGEVILSDGTVQGWQPRRYTGPLGDLTHYRPIRWVEFQYSSRDQAGLTGLASWLARQGGEDVVEVTLRLEVQETPFPGEPAPAPTTQTLLTYNPSLKP